MRVTHTYAILEISRAAYIEIRTKLEAAGYNDQIQEDGTVLMQGIGVKTKDKEVLGHDGKGPIYLEDLDAGALRDGNIKRKDYDPTDLSPPKTVNNCHCRACIGDHAGYGPCKSNA